jgi:hypothetical protein
MAVLLAPQCLYQMVFFRGGLRSGVEGNPVLDRCLGVLLIIQGLLPIGTVVLIRSVLKRLVIPLKTGAGAEDLGRVVLLQDHLLDKIHDQAVRLDMAYYDTADCYDQLNRAQVDAIKRSVNSLRHCHDIATS